MLFAGDANLLGRPDAGYFAGHPFGKAFSRTAGMTLHSYVLVRRMRQPRELLVKSDRPLADIAEAMGFSSQSHFTTAFPERTGVTPGRYRSASSENLSDFHSSFTKILCGGLDRQPLAPVI